MRGPLGRSSGPMRIFLDTNALIHFVSNDKIALLSNYESFTFEKCIYEFGLGFKSKLLDREFIIHALEDSEQHTSDTFEHRLVTGVIHDVKRELALTEPEAGALISSLKRYDLRWEFGTADEHPLLLETYMQFFGNQSIDGLLLLKRFFEASKSRLIEQLQDLIPKLGVRVISYKDIFGDPQHLLDFAEVLEKSVIPSKDLEITFAALSRRCRVLVTDDGKKSRGIFQGLWTLGLEYPIECVSIDDFISGKFVSSP